MEPFNKMLIDVRNRMLGHALTETKIRLFPFLIPKEHTLIVLENIRSYRSTARKFDDTEKFLTNYNCIQKIESFFFHYLHTLKKLAQTTRKFLQLGTLQLNTTIQIFRIQLDAMKEEILSGLLDLESVTWVSSFIKKYPYDDAVQLMINMDVRFFISEIRVEHLLKIVTTKELPELAGLLKPVLETAYWFDSGRPLAADKPTPEWEKDEQKRLEAGYDPLKKFLKERFTALEDLLIEHKLPTLFQRRVAAISKQALKSIGQEKGYHRYQSCLKQLENCDFDQSTEFTGKQAYLKFLGQAGLSLRNRQLVLQFSEKIYSRCKYALQKDGLFERAEKHDLLPGISFSDI